MLSKAGFLQLGMWLCVKNGHLKWNAGKKNQGPNTCGHLVVSF